MFRNQNIKAGFLDDSDLLYLSEDYELTFKNKRLRSGDLLTARTGYPGTTCLVPSKYEGAQSFTTLITRPGQSLVDANFLCCFINSEAGQKYFEQNQIGGGQKNVNAGSLKHLPVPLPPTKIEQEAIAAALSDADALIDSLEQLLAKKRLIKQGVMQELLTGKRRLPGFTKKSGSQQTELGAVPADWEIARLGDIGTVIRGASPRPKGDKRFYGGNVPRLMVEDVTRDGKVVFPQVDFLTVEGAKRSRPCKKGTLTIVCSGTVGIPSFLGVDACIHDGFLALVGIHGEVSHDYLYHQLCRLRETFDSSATHGGIFTNLTTAGVRDFKVPFPSSKGEQESIAQVLTDFDSEISALVERIAKARLIKLGMMQQLLTGKIRLI